MSNIKDLTIEGKQKILIGELIRKTKVIYENGDLENTENNDKILFYLLLQEIEENENIFPKEQFQRKDELKKLFNEVKNEIINEIKKYRKNKKMIFKKKDKK